MYDFLGKVIDQYYGSICFEAIGYFTNELLPLVRVLCQSCTYLCFKPHTWTEYVTLR